MPVSLDTSVVASWLRILGASQGWIDKAQAHCKAEGIAESDMVGARLVEDMLPFAYQIKSMVVHSQGAIEGIRNGVFSPDFSDPPADFAGLRESITGAITFLNAISADELEGMIGGDMRFEIGEKRLDFASTEDFLFSFSVSNFYFHAVTAYGILRNKGVDVGKMDYIGALPLKG